jgi:hypothetical protein
MSNEIVKSQNVIQTMDDAERAARSMSASGFFADSKSAAQAVVKILAGSELGFGPFASMTGVNIIQNKPVLAANLMAAAVKRNGKYNYRVVKHDEKSCSIDFYEGGEKVGNSTFTMDDAAKAGVASKDNWKKYPRNMLFARALSNGQKWYAPDIFNGATVYTPDELDATVDEEGNVVEVVETPHKLTIRERYTQLFDEARELGLPNIDEWQTTDSMTDNELVELGKLLRGHVEKLKAGK